jgi:hypothetical protein
MKKLYFSLFILLFFFFSSDAFSQKVLFVRDQGNNREHVLGQAIVNTGRYYDYYDALIKGKAPSADLLKKYDVVIWYASDGTDNLYLWDGNDTINQAVQSYIDGGGMFWLISLNYLHSGYNSWYPQIKEGDFAYDYLGIKDIRYSHWDDGNQNESKEEDTIPGNGIITFSPIHWSGCCMWGVNTYVLTDQAKPVYRIGPKFKVENGDSSGYLMPEKSDTIFPNHNYYSAVYNEKGNGKILTFGFDLGQIDSDSSCTQIMQQALDYFKQFSTQPASKTDSVYLSDLPIAHENYDAGWKPCNKDMSISGNPITINGRIFAKGLGCHAADTIVYLLNGKYNRFKTYMGVDDEVKYSSLSEQKATVTFSIYVDGVKKYGDGSVFQMGQIDSVNINVTGAKKLKLVVGNYDGSINTDHADFGCARLIVNNPTAVPSIKKDNNIRIYGYHNTIYLQSNKPMNGMFSIYNTLGQKMKQGFLNGTVKQQISLYTHTGYYFIRVMEKSGSVITQKVFIH